MTLRGKKSISSDIGHAEVHVPHCMQTLTFSPLSSLIFSMDCSDTFGAFIGNVMILSSLDGKKAVHQDDPRGCEFDKDLLAAKETAVRRAAKQESGGGEASFPALLPCRVRGRKKIKKGRPNAQSKRKKVYQKVI